MSDESFVHLGNRFVWNEEQPFGLGRRDRRQHVYVVGQTGSGKTTLLRNLVLQLVHAGEGVGLIDPHGDLAAELLDHIPPSRFDDVVYFNPADLDFPIAFNLLAGVPTDQRHLVSSGVVGAFKSIWRDSWGPRLEYILYAAIAALLDCQNTTILGVQRLLVDERYRAWVVKQVKDPMVRSFWLDEFEQYDDRFRREAIAPIQNKIGQLLMAPPIRNILGQVKSKIDPRFMMDDGRILIANLSKGRIGDDKANLLGAVLVSVFQAAAMSRADVPEGERTDFHLVVDEFHNFATDSFAAILSEARKYRLCLTLSHQYLNQLPDTIREAVFGNVGTLVSFRVGKADAGVLAESFGGTYPPSRYSDLANHEVCVKLLADGGYGDPFLGRTFPPAAPSYGRSGNLIRRSRERYATPRRVVEEKIERWMNR